MKEYPKFSKKATGTLNDEVHEESSGSRAAKRHRTTKQDDDLLD